MDINFNVNLTIGFDGPAYHVVQGISHKLDTVLANQEAMMAQMSDIVADVAAETTTIASLTTFIEGLQAQISALPGITPALQAQIDGVFTNLQANDAALAAAMTANVPPVTTPTAGGTTAPIPPTTAA